MEEENRADNSQQSSQQGTGASGPVAQPTLPPNQAGRLPAQKNTTTKIDEGVEEIEEAMKPFERQMLRLTIFGILIAAITGVIFYVQLMTMTYQTQILGSQAESAAGGAAVGEVNTRKQLSIAQQQAESAQRQAKAAQDSVLAIRKADQRSLLKFVLAGKASPNNPTQIEIPIAVGQPLSVDLMFQSIGKGAARKIISCVFIEIVDSKREAHLEWVDTAMTAKTSVKDPAPGVFTTAGNAFPGDAVPVHVERSRWVIQKSGTFEVDPVTQAEVDSLNAGDSYIAVYGMVTHSDSLGIHHWTKFCQWVPVKHPGRYHASKCTAYNDTDSN